MADPDILISEFIPRGLVLAQVPGSASQREPHAGDDMEMCLLICKMKPLDQLLVWGEKNDVWALFVLPAVCDRGGSSVLSHVTLRSHCHHVLGGCFIPSSAHRISWNRWRPQR